MKGKKQQGQAIPPPDAAASTPFFARFLEGQHGDAGEKAPVQFMTLKYPSDRDEHDPFVTPHGNAEAAPTEAGPSRMTLKYPSDRDEIDWYVSPHGNATNAP